MREQRVTFPNRDGQRLAARLGLPVSGRPRAFALFAHCFTCTKNIRAALNISRALTQAGIGVLRFDFTGLGESEGDFAETGFCANVQDLVAAAEYLAAEHGAPQLLVGHSLGGAATLRAAPMIPQARAVAVIGAPARAAHVLHLLGEARHTIETQGKAEVLLAGRAFTIGRQFIEDLSDESAERSLRDLRRALLVLHSPVDDTVSIDNAAEIYRSAVHPKSFVSLDGADHLLSREADARYAGAVLAAWADRYLEYPGATPLEAAPGAVVARTEHEGFFTEVNASGHALVADEPPSVGGGDAGPTPYGLLAAALATCTSMTLQMYARRKKLALEAAVVEVRHDKIHAEDCRECETRDGRIDRFQRTLKLEGSLAEADRLRLLEIADRCPVHRTLHAEVVVETHLEES